MTKTKAAPRRKMLSFTVDAKTLREALERVGRAASRRGSVEVLSGVHLSIEDSELIVWATDMDLCLLEQIPVGKGTGEPCVVPHVDKLIAGLKTLDGELAFKASSQNRLEVADTEWTTLNYQTLPAEDMPTHPFNREREKGDRATVGVPVALDDLTELHRFVARCASKEETRPVLQGMHLERHETGLIATATDSYRLAVDTCQTGPGEFLEMLVPAQDVTRTLRFMKGEKVLVLQQMVVHANLADEHAKWLIVSAGRRQACMRHIDGQFPNWRQLIPENYEVTVATASKPLEKALKRIQTIAHVNAPARLEPHEKELVVSYQGHDGPGVRSVMPAAVVGDLGRAGTAFGVNPGFLYDALDGFDEHQVQLNLINPLRPVLVSDEGWSPNKQTLPGRCYLVMPIRLPE